jgi:hypothetical protein
MHQRNYSRLQLHIKLLQLHHCVGNCNFSARSGCLLPLARHDKCCARGITWKHRSSYLICYVTSSSMVWLLRDVSFAAKKEAIGAMAC